MHLSADILSYVRRIEIYARRLLVGGLVGRNRSAIKGSGLEFEQMRDYIPGDDVRYIDWNASSRLDRLVVREYIEEKNKTILLVLDVSSSMFFSAPAYALKQENSMQLAAVLAFVASYAQDKIGLILFSDDVEMYIPPRHGVMHARYLAQQLFSYVPKKIQTSWESVIAFVARLKMRDAIIFFISDFLDVIPASLSTIARRHDLITVFCRDPYETQLPAVGLLSVIDPETGEQSIIDVRNKSNADCIASFLQQQNETCIARCRRYGAHVLKISTDQPFIHEVVRFFRHRMDY